MKKFLTVAMALIVACGVTFAESNDQKQIRKERQEITKLAKKELNTKVGKVVKKEAKRLKKEGKSILMISEELPELIGMSDRILIMKDGRISRSFSRSENLTESELIRSML